VAQIYVGNIPFSKTQEEIGDMFSQYGEVTSVKFINDRETGRFRGFGFVEMTSEDAAQKAIENLANSSCEGRTLRVNEARPKQPRAPRDTW
jgi:RNA recognition motif-containing protein